MTAASPIRLVHNRDADFVRYQRRPSPGEFSGLLAGRACDPRAFRRAYPDRWMNFMRAHFCNALHAAVFFDVDEKTARLWWEGVNSPQGWAVEFAIRSIPAAAEWLDAA